MQIRMTGQFFPTAPSMPANNFIKKLERRVIKGKEITPEEALILFQLSGTDTYDLFTSANRIREFYKGNKIDLCSIINVKSGRCAENCSFCSQSIHHRTRIKEYPLLAKDKILTGAKEARRKGAKKFGLVTSGKTINSAKEFKLICETIKGIKEEKNIHCCASLGTLTPEKAARLKQAGLKEYHHNLETAASFYPQICGTRDYQENVKTIRTAKKANLRTCAGGIFGLGESRQQRIELAFSLKELEVDSIPLNFLHPIKGTPLENRAPLQPLEILKIIAVFRFILFDKDIKVAGGREKNLRDLQSMIFLAGANSILLGNYLTTKGRSCQQDLQMIADLELEIN